MVWLNVVYGLLGSLAFAADVGKPAFIADLSRDCTAFYKRFRDADSDRSKANAVVDLCQLHNQVWMDPRRASIEELRGLRNKIVVQLKSIQKELRKQLPKSKGKSSSPTGDEGVASQWSQAGEQAQRQDAWLSPLLLAMQYTPGPSQIAVHAGAFGGGDSAPELISLIQATIHPEHWDINGGPGHIHYYRPVMALVIRAGTVQHEETTELLQRLRDLGQ
jgi:hypothetical protein